MSLGVVQHVGGGGGGRLLQAAGIPVGGNVPAGRGGPQVPAGGMLTPVYMRGLPWRQPNDDASGQVPGTGAPQKRLLVVRVCPGHPCGELLQEVLGMPAAADASGVCCVDLVASRCVLAEMFDDDIPSESVLAASVDGGVLAAALVDAVHDVPQPAGGVVVVWCLMSLCGKVGGMGR